MPGPATSGPGGHGVHTHARRAQDQTLDPERGPDLRGDWERGWADTADWVRDALRRAVHAERRQRDKHDA